MLIVKCGFASVFVILHLGVRAALASEGARYGFLAIRSISEKAETRKAPLSRLSASISRRRPRSVCQSSAQDAARGWLSGWMASSLAFSSIRSSIKSHSRLKAYAFRAPAVDWINSCTSA